MRIVIIRAIGNLLVKRIPMFPSAIIVFREVFEIAIILCVILAATRQVAHRSMWVVSGLGIGAAAVGVVACFVRSIAEVATQLGEHVFHALVLFTAAALISVSVVWMQQHGRQMVAEMREMTQSIKSGHLPLYSLTTVIALAVLREGSEIVLFLYGIFTAGQTSITDILVGSLLGVLLGIATGVVMYLGLIRIPTKQLFSVSGWFLALLAAGMAAKGAGHLVKVNLLPALINPIWDTSGFLSQHSLAGRFLSVLVGYQDQPAGIQVIFYVVTLALISTILLQKWQPKFISNPA